MKKIQVPSKLLLIISVLLGLATFVFDYLKFESSLGFPQWQYVHEVLTLVIIVFFYGYVKNLAFIKQEKLSITLKNFIKLLTGLYLWALIFKFFMNPSYSAAFPPVPDTLSSLIYSNLASISSILFLVPMIILVKNLIYFKQRSRTRIYTILALISTVITMTLSVVFQAPLSETTGNGIYVSTSLVVTLIFYALLGTNNTWITYLSRKEKYTYFLVSVVLVWIIIILYGFAFLDSVAAHSISLDSFTNLAWYFLTIYALFSSITFLFHLPTARVFDRKMKEVSSLHQLGRVISAEFNSEKLVDIVTGMTTEVIESNHTWIELYDEKRDNLFVAAADNLDVNDLESFNNHSIHEIGLKLIETKQPITLNNITKNGEYASIKKWRKDIGSLAAAPLIDAAGKVLGIIFATKSYEFGFDPDDLKMLEAYANQAAIALENAKLVKNSLERERLEQELQIAREVQMRLLPQKVPSSGNLKIDTLTITAYEVGGDYYDFFPTKENNLGLIIGDVSGKGTSAAFYMAETKGIIQSITRNYYSPYDILVNTNTILFDSLEKKSFITLLVAQIDYKKQLLRFARGGHCPVLHYRAKEQETDFLQPSGIAIGLDNGEVFDTTLKEEKVKLADDDILAFYTDGLSEAMNKENDEFGDERLGEIIKNNAHLEVDALKEKVIDEILAFLDGQNLHDDLTLVLVKC
ncbi:MAG: GAF domain-containing protein [Calditrichaeota bacterium]|nr:MAG: GAF domain-containing protein [Calditrichota bacterium]MBL1204308.1 GAF domain-containing protein [Calditrichota bacterium]NOG44138.1 SpoIIE family protein phosphatase [Calditrichota bacterium]